MAYKDTKLTQVCPYNGFCECFYDDCPFFDKSADYFRVYSIKCKRAIMELNTYKNDINVSVDNRQAVVVNKSMF